MSIEKMTIDETIDGLCDQMGFGDPVLINAILHLRAYKENNPLIWEDLKSMEGKPVWVEYTKTSGMYQIHFKGWMLIGFVSEEFIRFIGTFAMYGYTGEKDQYEKKWTAYKKEHGAFEATVIDIISGKRVDEQTGLL